MTERTTHQVCLELKIIYCEDFPDTTSDEAVNEALDQIQSDGYEIAEVIHKEAIPYEEEDE